MEKLMIRINDYMEANKTQVADNSERLDECESNITELQATLQLMRNDQKWIAGICSFVGGIVGFLINIAVHFFVKGG